MKISRWLLVAGFALVIFGAKLALIDYAAGDVPVLDQWDGELRMAIQPWLTGQLTWGELIHPHNEHRVVTTKLYAIGLTAANGQWDGLVEMALNAAIHTFVALLLLVLGRRWLRGWALITYGALLLLLFALPFGWENTLAGFQVQFYFLVIFALGHLWLTLGDARFSWSWGLGQICGALAIVTMASGFFSSAAILAVLGWTFWRERRLTAQQMTTAALAATACIAGWSLRYVVAGHEVLKAHTVGEFASALLQTLSWPGPAYLPFVAIPTAWFGVRWLRGMARAPLDATLAGLAIWMLLQCMAMAYGRANGWVLSSRYLDLYTLNVALSFLLLAREANTPRKRWLTGLWFVGAAAALISIGLTAWNSGVVSRRNPVEAQQDRLAVYVRTGDRSALAGRTWPEIAYPHDVVLIDRVSSPAVRQILPASVRVPLDLGSGTPAAPRQLPESVQLHAGLPVAFSSYPASSVVPSWRSATMPDTAAPFLRFLVLGDLGPGHPNLRLVAKSAAGEVPIVPDRAAGTRWKNVTIHRPAGAWWIEAQDRDPSAWFAFSQPVELGPLSWFARKTIKFNPWFFWPGVACLAIGLVLWGRDILQMRGGLRATVSGIRARSNHLGPKCGMVLRHLLQAAKTQITGGTNRPGRGPWLAASAALVIGKLWLVGGQTVLANGWAGHDDRLFLELARHILRGEWLGPYSQFTLMKGPAYPLFVAGNFLTGVPLFTAQHLFYAGACGLLVLALQPLLSARWLRFGLFATLLFNPMTYETVVHGRVLRQNIYHSLALCALAGLVALYARRSARARHLIAWAALAGVALAAFWLTREEGVWLLPLVGLVWLILFWQLWRERPADRRLRAAVYVLPAVLWLGDIGLVCTLNSAYYGWFGTVEFKAKEFKDAYGALCRVTPKEWSPNIPVRREVRERIYAVSPAFAELRPQFEGALGEGWAGAGGNWVGLPTSQHEIGAGWFMWALRDAVIAVGHNRSAAEVLAFYGRVAREVNAACEDGRLAAGPPHSGFLPPWRPLYTQRLAGSFAKTAGYFLTFDGFVAESQPSTGTLDSLVLFQDLSRDRLSPIPGTGAAVPPQQRWLDRLRVRILTGIGRLYQGLVVPAAVGAALAFLAGTVLAAKRRRLDFWFVLNLGLIGACLAMVLINALVDATSFPTTSPGGYTANYPLYLLFLWTAWFQFHTARYSTPNGQ